MELFLIVFLPLIGSVLSGFFGKMLGLKLSHFISCLLVVIPSFLSSYLFYKVLSGIQTNDCLLYTSDAADE